MDPPTIRERLRLDSSEAEKSDITARKTGVLELPEQGSRGRPWGVSRFRDADDDLTDDSIDKRMALFAEVPELELVYSNYFLRQSKDSVTVRFSQNYPENTGLSAAKYLNGIVFRGEPF